MNDVLTQLAVFLGASFTWSEQSGSITITSETEDSIISKIWIAEQGINETPLKCVSVSINERSLSLIFEKPKETEEKEVA